MPQIEITEEHPKCILQGDWVTEEVAIPLCTIRYYLNRSYRVWLLVSGWVKPWSCFLGDDGEIHACCPIAPKVSPRVVQVASDLSAPPKASPRVSF